MRPMSHNVTASPILARDQTRVLQCSSPSVQWIRYLLAQRRKLNLRVGKTDLIPGRRLQPTSAAVFGHFIAGRRTRAYRSTVTNTRTGFGQRIRADQPIAKINMWSIHTTYSLEPYIAISLKPGETKRWTYTYDFYGPGEKP